MASSPTFSIGDVVYLEASAKLGFLESYLISTIHQITADKWAYKIGITLRNPAVSTIGDTLTGHTSLGLNALFFDEAELLTYCDASSLAIANLQRRLTSLQTQRTGKC